MKWFLLLVVFSITACSNSTNRKGTITLNDGRVCDVYPYDSHPIRNCREPR